MYVYIPVPIEAEDPDHYEVGFYTPEGGWVKESEHDTKREASARVVYLNGGDFRDEQQLAEAPTVE